jgi:hypothetical protein
MKRMIITDEMIDHAKHEWSPPFKNQYSIAGDDAYWIGNLAEMVFAMTYPEAIRINNGDSLDDRLNGDFILKGMKIDVKTKKRTTFVQPDFSTSIPARFKNYKFDWFAFYSYNVKAKVLEWCGWYNREQYFIDGMLIRAGSPFESNRIFNAGKQYDADQYDLKIKQLIP